MIYGTAALAALLTFLAPCVLPLLPVYVSYFTAEKSGVMRTLIKVLAFCAGISIFFILLFGGAITASNFMQAFINKYQIYINFACGMLLILFGLKFMGYLSIPFMDKAINIKTKTENVNFLDAFIMGLVFSLTLGSCALGFIWAPLKDIIMEANLFNKIMVSLTYILVLNAMFIAFAMLIDQLKGVLKFLKKHYKIINMVSGILLVVLGILIAFGLMDKLTSLIQG